MFSLIAQAQLRYKQSNAAKRAFKLPPRITGNVKYRSELPLSIICTLLPGHVYHSVGEFLNLIGQEVSMIFL